MDTINKLAAYGNEIPPVAVAAYRRVAVQGFVPDIRHADKVYRFVRAVAGSLPDERFRVGPDGKLVIRDLIRRKEADVRHLCQLFQPAVFEFLQEGTDIVRIPLKSDRSRRRFGRIIIPEDVSFDGAIDQVRLIEPQDVYIGGKHKVIDRRHPGAHRDLICPDPLKEHPEIVMLHLCFPRKGAHHLFKIQILKAFHIAGQRFFGGVEAIPFVSDRGSGCLLQAGASQHQDQRRSK